MGREIDKSKYHRKFAIQWYNLVKTLTIYVRVFNIVFDWHIHKYNPNGYFPSLPRTENTNIGTVYGGAWFENTDIRYMYGHYADCLSRDVCPMYLRRCCAGCYSSYHNLNQTLEEFRDYMHDRYMLKMKGNTGEAGAWGVKLNVAKIPDK